MVKILKAVHRKFTTKWWTYNVSIQRHPMGLDDDQSAIFHLSTNQRQEFVFHPVAWRGTIAQCALHAHTHRFLASSFVIWNLVCARRTRSSWLLERVLSASRFTASSCADGSCPWNVDCWYRSSAREITKKIYVEKLTFISRNAVDGVAWANLSGTNDWLLDSVRRSAPFIDGWKKSSWNFNGNFNYLNGQGKLIRLIDWWNAICELFWETLKAFLNER